MCPRNQNATPQISRTVSTVQCIDTSTVPKGKFTIKPVLTLAHPLCSANSESGSTPAEQKIFPHFTDRPLG